MLTISNTNDHGKANIAGHAKALYPIPKTNKGSELITIKNGPFTMPLPQNPPPYWPSDWPWPPIGDKPDTWPPDVPWPPDGWPPSGWPIDNRSSNYYIPYDKFFIRGIGRDRFFIPEFITSMNITDRLAELGIYVDLYDPYQTVVKNIKRSLLSNTDGSGKAYIAVHLYNNQLIILQEGISPTFINNVRAFDMGYTILAYISSNDGRVYVNKSDAWDGSTTEQWGRINNQYRYSDPTFDNFTVLTSPDSGYWEQVAVGRHAMMMLTSLTSVSGNDRALYGLGYKPLLGLDTSGYTSKDTSQMEPLYHRYFRLHADKFGGNHEITEVFGEAFNIYCSDGTFIITSRNESQPYVKMVSLIGRNKYLYLKNEDENSSYIGDDAVSILTQESVWNGTNTVDLSYQYEFTMTPESVMVGSESDTGADMYTDTNKMIYLVIKNASTPEDSTFFRRAYSLGTEDNTRTFLMREIPIGKTSLDFGEVVIGGEQYIEKIEAPDGTPYATVGVPQVLAWRDGYAFSGYSPPGNGEPGIPIG